MTVHYFAIKGIGSFPDDMLRYDNGTIIGRATILGKPAVLIAARRCTEDRWASFTWTAAPAHSRYRHGSAEHGPIDWYVTIGNNSDRIDVRPATTWEDEPMTDTRKLPAMVRAFELNLGDVVKLSDGPWMTAIVERVSLTNTIGGGKLRMVHFARPYLRCEAVYGSPSLGSFTTPMTGIEHFAVYGDAEVTSLYELHQVGNLIDETEDER